MEAEKNFEQEVRAVSRRITEILRDVWYRASLGQNYSEKEKLELQEAWPTGTKIIEFSLPCLPDNRRFVTIDYFDQSIKSLIEKQEQDKLEKEVLYRDSNSILLEPLMKHKKRASFVQRRGKPGIFRNGYPCRSPFLEND